MATIRAVCTDCGDEVDLQPREITLVVAEEEATPPPAAGSYGFTCPECDRYVVKPADQRAIGLLIAGGVEPSRVGARVGVRTDRRPSHPESPPEGPPITHDDLIDFHFQLERDGWFSDVLALTIRPY